MRLEDKYTDVHPDTIQEALEILDRLDTSYTVGELTRFFMVKRDSMDKVDENFTKKYNSLVGKTLLVVKPDHKVILNIVGIDSKLQYGRPEIVLSGQCITIQSNVISIKDFGDESMWSNYANKDSYISGENLDGDDIREISEQELFNIKTSLEVIQKTVSHIDSITHRHE